MKKKKESIEFYCIIGPIFDDLSKSLLTIGLFTSSGNLAKGSFINHVDSSGGGGVSQMTIL